MHFLPLRIPKTVSHNIYDCILLAKAQSQGTHKCNLYVGSNETSQNLGFLIKEGESEFWQLTSGLYHSLCGTLLFLKNCYQSNRVWSRRMVGSGGMSPRKKKWN